MKERYEDLAVIRFEGERFAHHTLDVDVTQELVAYKKLVLECAKELWRRRNTDRVRLPRGFEEGFALVFSEIRDGSAGVPLKRRLDVGDDELPLPQEDEFAEAARLIDRTIMAADAGATLPSDFPRNVIPLYREFGKSLTPEESIFTCAAGQKIEAAYTLPVRERLANWTEATYEDLIDLSGEVSMANVRAGQFTLILDSGETPTGRFSAEQEALVLDALRHHREVRLRVKGVAEFNHADRSLRRLLQVDTVEITGPGEPAYDDSVRPIWEVVAEIGAQAPAETWANVPRDLSERIDEYVYGTPPTRP
jgi:hypothetical protein